MKKKVLTQNPVTLILVGDLYGMSEMSLQLSAVV